MTKRDEGSKKNARPGRKAAMMIANMPTTIAAAVQRLQEIVSKKDQATIAAMSEEDLFALHFGLGRFIRNSFGLHGGNSELLQATGAWDPDDASGVIIRAFWESLRKAAGPSQSGLGVLDI
jgi:hypothetical protein